MNGKHVQGAKTDFACINGRCILNADARIGGRRAIAPENANETIAKSLQWNESTTSGLKDLDFQKPVDSGGTALLSKRSHGGKGQGETLQVQMSAPVRFYLLKYLKGRTSSSFWSDIEPVLGGSLPSDDDWILMDVNVKKYGLLLLNAVFPELTWESGDSDIKLRVSGTLTEPVVEGKVSVRDGRVFSLLLSEPLQGIRGEIEFRKAGIVTVRSVSGRCAGKGFNANGDIFYSQFHRNRLSKSLKADIEVLKELKASDSESKKQRKLLQSRQSASRSILAKTRQGLTLDFGEFPVNFQNVVLSKLSGKVHIVESLANPVVSGALTLSDGLISLGNAVGMPRNTLEDRRKNFSPQDLRPQSDEFLVKGETKGADENGSEADIESSTKPLRSGNVNPILDDFRVNIGRGMKFVQPLMLSLDTNGALVLNGSPRDPVIEGEIRAPRGRVNLFATRMSIRKHAKNYIRFVKPNKTNASKTGDGAEPLINATLESEDLLVRIPECSLSKWAAHIEVTNKSGERLSGSSWDALVQSELGELRNPETMARFLTKYVFKAVEAGGKAGKFEWRMFPTIVKRNDGEISRQLKDEIGAGGEVEMGGLAIGGKRSSDGTVGGNMRLRVRDWLSWEVEKEGMKQTSRIKMKVNLTGRRKKKYKYTRRDLQTGQHDEQQNGSRREMKGQVDADPGKEGGELHADEPENAAEGFRETPNAEGEKSPEGKLSPESAVKQFGTNGVVSKPGGTDSSQKVREEK